MNRSPSKRKQAVRRAIIYTIMTMTVVGVTVALVFFTLGYRFNREEGTFQQGGLVQFISQPTGASVTVGQAHLANKTRSRITLNPGDYLVKMERDGYRTWEKSVSVEAGKVLWLNSALLVPQNPETSSLLTTTKLADTSFRSDGKYIALLEDATKPRVQVVTTSGGKASDTDELVVSTSLYTSGKKHSFSLEKWDSDSDWFLMRHVVGKTTEWMVVNRADMTKTMRLPVAGSSNVEEVLFDPRSNNQLLARYSDGTVRVVTIDSAKVSEPLIRNAASIELGGNWTVVYTTLPKDKSMSVGYLTLDTTTPRVISSFDTGKPVTAAIETYYGATYIAVSQGKKATISQVTNWPRSDSQAPLQTKMIAELSLVEDVAFTAIRGQGRFVTLEQSKNASVYDLELNKEYAIPLAGVKKSVGKKLPWLEQFHFWNDATGYLRQYEFDGTNQTPIVSVAPGFEAAYDGSQEFLYSIGRTSDGYTLQSTAMRIE